MNKWYVEKGDCPDVVVSTRIRLARNLDAFPFPAKLDSKGKQTVNETIKNAVTDDKNGKFSCIEMSALTPSQAVSMAERHLISPEFASVREGRMLLLTEDESVSIMLCEEDHIRLQVMKAGLALKETYDIADKIDSFIDGRLKYAFDERIGYLTQCPTNLGTAMRASVMLHLPALTMTGKISQLSSTVSKLGLVIRGAFGEGSTPQGDLYQLSNQITLGITEEAAIDNLQSIALQLVNQERAVASKLVESPAEEDKIFRSLGILQSARLLSGAEFMELISLVRLGAARGLLKIDLEKINELIVDMQPATLNSANGERLDHSRRDAIRAETVRQKLAI